MVARCLYVRGTDASDAVLEWLTYKFFCDIASVVFVPYFTLRYSIYYWIMPYTVLADTAVYLFMTSAESNFGGKFGG